METIAIYWEPEIKTYGLFERTGLSMVSFSLSVAGYGRDNRRILRAAAAADLLLNFAHLTASGDLRLYLFFNATPQQRLLEAFKTLSAGGGPCDVSVETEVALIYFNGPHFGDRYGIADAAFQALDIGNIPILAAACSSASVFIALPKQTIQEARKALAASFFLPDGAPAG